MAEAKENGAITSQIDIEATNMNLSAEKKGTADDQRDMFRLGKSQELRVCADQSLITYSTSTRTAVANPQCHVA